MMLQGLSDFFHQTVEIYVAQLDEIREDLFSADSHLVTSLNPQWNCAALESNGNCSIISVADNVTVGMHNSSMYSHADFMNSPKFQLVAPVCLGLALMIIVLTLHFSPLPVEEDRNDGPVAVSNAPAWVPRADTSQIKQFAVEKALSINDTSSSGVHTPVSNRNVRLDDPQTPMSTLTGESDRHFDSHSIYSIDNTDDGLSQISRLEQVDRDLAIIMRQSKQDPHVLLGWKISVQGKGTGVVVEVVRRWAMTTMFKVQFDNGKSELLPLKRSANKGTVPFTPITKVK